MKSEHEERDAIQVDRSVPNSEQNSRISASEEPEANRDARPEEARPEEARPEEAMLYCPVCSTRLAQSRCKLVCRRCGYYMSCADYY